tara:strand:- start:135 stop:1532 length:1398 start_codon:yes stop_codon:yes gene_type:complete
MPATQLTLSNILKEFYLGPVQEQLNNEVMVLDLMTKATVDWNGRVAIIPIHVSRNTGVGFRGESDGTAATTLPPAGDQGYQQLQVNAHFLYGRFQITGPAMSAAGKGGANSFIGWMEAEMDKLVNDVKSASDNAMISGGRVVGFLNEHKATAGAAPAVDTWECFGDIEKIEALRAAVVASGSTELLVDLVRVDRNAALGYTVLPNCVQIQLTATDVINRTITLEVVDLNGAGANYDTSPTDDGFAVAVVISAAQQAAPATAVTNALDQQPRGIFENLGSRAHFGVNRFSPASGTEFPVLQSTIITQVVGGAQARAALALPRMQAAMDQVHQLSGQEPDCILISPLARQQYAALFQLTANTSAAVMNTSGERANKLDGGFSGLSYGGLPIKTARHVGGGGMIFLKLSTWKVLELEAHGFADLDGSVLARAGVGVAGVDAYEGYYRWYYNTVTTNPNQNAILCGFDV